jgi:hypothetical protein
MLRRERKYAKTKTLIKVNIQYLTILLVTSAVDSLSKTEKKKYDGIK